MKVRRIDRVRGAIRRWAIALMLLPSLRTETTIEL